MGNNAVFRSRCPTLRARKISLGEFVSYAERIHWKYAIINYVRAVVLVFQFSFKRELSGMVRRSFCIFVRNEEINNSIYRVPSLFCEQHSRRELIKRKKRNEGRDP